MEKRKLYCEEIAKTSLHLWMIKNQIWSEEDKALNAASEIISYASYLLDTAEKLIREED